MRRPQPKPFNVNKRFTSDEVIYEFPTMEDFNGFMSRDIVSNGHLSVDDEKFCLTVPLAKPKAVNIQGEQVELTFATTEELAIFMQQQEVNVAETLSFDSTVILTIAVWRALPMNSAVVPAAVAAGPVVLPSSVSVRDVETWLIFKDFDEAACFLAQQDELFRDVAFQDDKTIILSTDYWRLYEEQFKHLMPAQARPAMVNAPAAMWAGEDEGQEACSLADLDPSYYPTNLSLQCVKYSRTISLGFSTRLAAEHFQVAVAKEKAVVELYGARIQAMVSMDESEWNKLCMGTNFEGYQSKNLAPSDIVLFQAEGKSSLSGSECARLLMLQERAGKEAVGETVMLAPGDAIPAGLDAYPPRFSGENTYQKQFEALGIEEENRFISPISFNVMDRPIQIPGGCVLDYSDIEGMRDSDAPLVCPKTRVPFTLSSLTPAMNVRAEIEQTIANAKAAKSRAVAHGSNPPPRPRDQAAALNSNQALFRGQPSQAAGVSRVPNL